MRLGNIYSAAFFIVLGIVFYLETFNFPNKAGSADVGSAFWPRILITIIIILSMAQIMISIKEKGSSKGSKSITFVDILKKLTKPLVGIVLCFVFFFLYKVIGFAIAVFALYVGLASLMYPKLNLKSFAIISSQAVFLILIIFLLFDLFLKVDLPSGILF